MESFARLSATRLLLEQTLTYARISIAKYRDPVSGGFTHLLAQPKEAGDFSKASTATCLTFLYAAGYWEGEWADKSAHLRDEIIEGRWASSGLADNNPFTISFLLEALATLRDAGYPPLPDQPVAVDEDYGLTPLLPINQSQLIDEKLVKLQQAFVNGGIQIDPYPPTAFLTYKALHALKAWGRLPISLKPEIENWAWSTLHEESVLVASGSPNADVYELAYAVLTASAAAELQEMTPPQRDTLAYALDQFFDAQDETGSWSRGRPLFLYPKLGNAYCYKYELLVHLLDDVQLRPFLVRHVDVLIKAAESLQRERFPLGEAAWGWSSGHLRQIKSAESWSTASVFHYCHSLNELISDALRQELFEYLGSELSLPVAPPRSLRIRRDRFLDAPIHREGDVTLSLLDTIDASLLDRLSDGLDGVERGQPFPVESPLSLVLYGPPGTSKNRLSALIAHALGWPLLRLDPSHLTRFGMNQLYAETYKVFKMLSATERIVLLLDEFDDLVRGASGEDLRDSRYLSTALLPRITALRRRRRVVILLATSHIVALDELILKPGRFDLVLPVAPPTLEAKVHRWPHVNDRASELGLDLARADSNVCQRMRDLTYLEFAAISSELASAASDSEFQNIVNRAWEQCTMQRSDAMTRKWRQELEDNRAQIRVPSR